MNDLISRQKAIEIIKNYCENGCDYAEDNWCPSCQRKKFVELLKALPSAQPEIIRCKDCKHRDVEDGFCEGRGWPMQLVPDDGFCDKGERSEE